MLQNIKSLEISRGTFEEIWEVLMIQCLRIYDLTQHVYKRAILEERFLLVVVWIYNLIIFYRIATLTYIKLNNNFNNNWISINDLWFFIMQLEKIKLNKAIENKAQQSKLFLEAEKDIKYNFWNTDWRKRSCIIKHRKDLRRCTQ